MYYLLNLSLFVLGALTAPAPTKGPSFPITDIIDSGLSIEEYAAQLSNKGSSGSPLGKRQYSGSTYRSKNCRWKYADFIRHSLGTYNQLTDSTPCREISLIFARGTTQDGNVGAAGTEGPTFFNALASRLGGTSRLAIQGVTYPANVAGFLAGGDAAGS
ncbi:MAG: cutinase family protein, partial [Hymenobacter sp.]